MPVSSCRCVSPAVMSGTVLRLRGGCLVSHITLARIDILPEDGPTVTETCRRFYEILAF
jgi:hypothetical protein